MDAFILVIFSFIRRCQLIYKYNLILFSETSIYQNLLGFSPNFEGEGEIFIKTWQEGEDQVKISIRDTGQGMPEEVRKRIFEPFFTTKDVGEGTGLGLSISYNIIEQHGGQIEVQSTPNQGADFVLTLPVSE